MYGGMITPPDDDGAHFGVLFWHKDGFSTACGHGTIALGAWAIHSGRVATDPLFAAAREAQLDQLLAVVGPELPVLIADLPAISEGRFSGAEMTSPDRLAAVNAQIVDWDQRLDQVPLRQ